MIDLKFDIDGKKLSSNDINAKKDFESFHKKVLEKSKHFYQKSWFWTTTGLASFILTFMLVYNKYNHRISNEASNSIIEGEKKCLIHPPFNEFFLNVSVCYTIPGSIIKAQKSAFTRPKGKLVTNQIISVPPIIYDSAEITHMLYSADMIRIYDLLDDSIIRFNPEKIYNSLGLNEKLNYKKKDTIYIAENSQKKKSSENQKSNIVIPDNLVQLELQKTPQYKKNRKRRIQIKQ